MPTGNIRPFIFSYSINQHKRFLGIVVFAFRIARVAASNRKVDVPHREVGVKRQGALEVVVEAEPPRGDRHGKARVAADLTPDRLQAGELGLEDDVVGDPRLITGLTGALLLAMVGLIAYAREFQSQPERWATTPSPSWGDGGTYADDDESGWSYRAAAEAGYPGAWDEEDDYPRHAATGG